MEEDKTHHGDDEQDAQDSEDQKPKDQDYEGGGEGAAGDPPATDPGDVPGPGKTP